MKTCTQSSSTDDYNSKLPYMKAGFIVFKKKNQT